jgi:hypothetical protein
MDNPLGLGLAEHGNIIYSYKQIVRLHRGALPPPRLRMAIKFKLDTKAPQ